MRFITVAIHTYEKALALRSLLESEGISVELNNVNLEVPGFSSGVRVRIPETDLPLALRIIENKELFLHPTGADAKVHTVLVPVDLSENSFKAACVAANLAHTIKGKMVFLYSYIDPYIAGNVQFTDSFTYEVGETGAREQMVVNARKLLHNFYERVRNAMKKGHIPVVKAEQVVVEGVPEDAIVNYAKDKAPYIIVMGTRGADKKDRELIGSVTAEVLDEGRFTVLTVPEPLEIEDLRPRNILFMGNLDQDDILAMDALYRLFGSESASVTIVHMPNRRRFTAASADKALRRLSDYCRENFSQYHFLSVPVSQSDVEKEFLALQEKNNYDLIVVPNRHRNAFSRLFNPGLAHKILFHTDIPMLILPV